MIYASDLFFEGDRKALTRVALLSRGCEPKFTTHLKGETFDTK